MNAAQLLRRIRAHERACRWSCDQCKAKLEERETAARRQRDCEVLLRRFVDLQVSTHSAGGYGRPD